MHRLPAPRGELSEGLLGALVTPGGSVAGLAVPTADDPLADEDLQLALYLCYELHYRGLPGVDDRWEWEPALLALRAALELQFEQALLDEVPLPRDAIPADEIDVALRAISERDSPPLSTYIRSRATLEQ